MTKWILTEKMSRALYAAKCFAILCAVAAHCGGYSGVIPARMGHLLGTLGVPLFLLLSGYFFDGWHNGFWRKRVRSIVAPWLVWSALTFALSVLLGTNPLQMGEFFRWTLGCDSWLYYVPILLGCYVLFGLCRGRLWTWSILLVWVVSHTLTAAGVLDGVGPFTIYQNLFNWAGYFGMGVLLRDIDLEGLLRRMAGWRWAMYALCGLVCAVYLSLTTPSYWTYFSIPCQLLCCAGLLCLAYRLSDWPLLLAVGRRTYPIFFVHMQLGIGLLNRLLLNRLLPVLGYGEYVFVFLCPILVVLLTYAILVCAQWCAERMGLSRVWWLFAMGETKKGAKQ